MKSLTFDSTEWINDGFHRVAEHIINGETEIEADIYILE